MFEQNYLLVNFGGPRNLSEISPFLVSLLQDRDVIHTHLPSFIHNWFFGRIARKRALQIQHDYESIGGKSPIYFDTEMIACLLREKLHTTVLTFHRYLPATHAESLKKIEVAQNLCVLPLFPQFCHATTGSIARFLQTHLSRNTQRQLHWIKSYAAHPAFIRAYQRKITDFLKAKYLAEEDTVLLFSAHGIPQQFIQEGDIYESECSLSFHKVMEAFPKALGHLAYQSKFGRGEWLRPYTNESCEQVLSWHQGRKNIVFIPITFTSDHIETLFEIENLYLPIISKKGLRAFRCPALNLEDYWIDAIINILSEKNLFNTKSLIRR